MPISPIGASSISPLSVKPSPRQESVKSEKSAQVKRDVAIISEQAKRLSAMASGKAMSEEALEPPGAESTEEPGQ